MSSQDEILNDIIVAISSEENESYLQLNALYRYVFEYPDYDLEIAMNCWEYLFPRIHSTNEDFSEEEERRYDELQMFFDKI